MTTKILTDRFGSVISGNSHDDMLGRLETGISGSNSWLVQNIRDSLVPCGFLRNNSNDFAIIRIQSPHTRKQGVPLDSIHIHYVVDAQVTAGQTLLFTTYWTWLYPNQAVPALADWQQVNTTWTVSQTIPIWTYGLYALVTSPAAPTTEGYGLTLLCRIVRGNGTATANLGIIDCDAHVSIDRNGSFYEFSDTP